MKNKLKAGLVRLQEKLDELNWEAKELLKKQTEEEAEMYSKLESLTLSLLPQADFHNLTDKDIKILSRNKEWKSTYEVWEYYDQFFGYDYNRRLVRAIEDCMDKIEGLT